MEIAILVTTISCFALIQSVFGVGLLLFGTPTLILLGYKLDFILLTLLPSSMVISFLQIYPLNEQKFYTNRPLILYCFPFVLISLLLHFILPRSIDLSLFVAIMLIISGLMRSSQFFASLLINSSRKFNKVYLVIMGLIHGYTNMGGGLLTFYSATLNQDKEKVREVIAFGYLFMGVIQYSVTIIVHGVEQIGLGLILSLISSLCYLLVGNHLFLKINQKLFHFIITFVIFCYGSILLFFN